MTQQGFPGDLQASKLLTAWRMIAQVCKAMSSPFCQPPPRRSLSFGNMSTQAPSHSLAGSSISATEMRAPAPASSPFLRDQQGLGGVNTPFGAWQCMMGGQPQEEPATAGVHTPPAALPI